MRLVEAPAQPERARAERDRARRDERHLRPAAQAAQRWRDLLLAELPSPN